MNTIKNLVDLAVLIEIGGFNFTGLSDKSITRLLSLSEEARKGNIQIKQEPKQIDMKPFIKNGLDCEFSDGGYNIQHKVVSPLFAIEDSIPFRFSTNEGANFKHCRPRLNHPFIWEGQELPEGLVVEYGYVNEGIVRWHEDYHSATNLAVARIKGCKEGYTFAGGE